jgi:hypothetical protein
MSGGETSLSGTDDNSLALKYTPGYESVFINGVLQVRGSDYVATTGTTVTGLIALTASDVVMVESIIAYSVGDTYTQTQIGSLLDAKSPVSTTGLVLLNTTTFSAVTSVSINDVFSATYDNYVIELTDLVPATTGNVSVRLRVAGADNSSSNYLFGRMIVGAAASQTFATANNTTSTSFVVVSAITSVDNNFATFKLFNPFTVKKTGFSVLGAGNSLEVGGGNMTVTTSYTGFTLLNANGGNIAGTIKVYGYK